MATTHFAQASRIGIADTISTAKQARLLNPWKSDGKRCSLGCIHNQQGARHFAALPIVVGYDGLRWCGGLDNICSICGLSGREELAGSSLERRIMNEGLE
jgi:hypothetical protein